MLYKLNIKSHSKVEFQDITERINQLVSESGIENGICVVFVPHTTAGITINEHADPGVVADIITQLDKMVPHQAAYKHDEGNSAAHIKATLTGASSTVVVQFGELALGTWQGIFFCEFDGPRNREIMVKIMADGED